MTHSISCRASAKDNCLSSVIDQCDILVISSVPFCKNCCLSRLKIFLCELNIILHKLMNKIIEQRVSLDLLLLEAVWSLSYFCIICIDNYSLSRGNYHGKYTIFLLWLITYLVVGNGAQL